MINWVLNKLLTKKFKKRFVHYNKYTLKAFKCTSDTQFQKLFWKCVNDTAHQNNKDIQDISLEDIYRTLHKIRQKMPKLFRKITLKQMTKIKKTGNIVSDIFNLIYGMSSLNIIPLIYVGLKKIFGIRVEYVIKIYIVSMIAQELYKQK